MKNIFLPLIFALALIAGCAFNGENNDDVSKQIRDVEHLDQLYAPLVGTYRGSVVSENPKTERPIELYINNVHVQTGLYTNDGRPIMRPTLKARLRYMDNVEEDLEFEAAYIEETGKLTMTTPTANPGGAPAVRQRALQGQIGRDRFIAGTLIEASGNLGTVKLNWTGEAPSAYLLGNDEELRKRLYEQFDPLEGNYDGFVTSLSDREKKFKARIALFVVENLQANDRGEIKGKPTLRARYKRYADNNSVVEDIYLNVSYSGKDKTIVLSSQPPEGGGGNPQGQGQQGQSNRQSGMAQAGSGIFISIKGTLDQKQLIGEVTNQLGIVGKIDVVYNSADRIPESSFDSDADQRELNENLVRLYTPLQGLYKGQVTETNEQHREFSVELMITLLKIPTGSVSSSGKPIFRPILQGRLKRLESTDSDIGFNIQYHESGEIILTNQEVMISIDGVIKDKIIRGYYKANGGTVGTITLTWDQPLAPAPFNGEEDDTRTRLLNVFKPLEGNYDGEVKPPPETSSHRGESFKTRVAIYIMEVQNGVNAYGEPRFLPTLRARYKRLAPNPDPSRPVIVAEDRRLTVRYYSDTKEMVLSQGDGSFGSILKVNGGDLSGSVFDQLGIIGPMTLKKDTSNPVPESAFQGEIIEERARLKNIMDSVTGVYHGRIEPVPGGILRQGEAATLTIYTVEEPNATYGVVPGLRASYLGDKDDIGLLRFMIAQYFPTTSDLALVSDGRMPNSTVAGAGFFAMTGTLKNKQVNLLVRDHRGILGRFTGSR